MEYLYSRRSKRRIIRHGQPCLVAIYHVQLSSLETHRGAHLYICIYSIYICIGLVYISKAAECIYMFEVNITHTDHIHTIQYIHIYTHICILYSTCKYEYTYIRCTIHINTHNIQ